MNGIVRPSEAWIYGVVAGLSARLELSTTWCRVAALGLLYIAPLKALVIYCLALWLMPKSWRGC
ncbi:PspC domain-containing protein [Ferrimonas lipolytica]|uniref:PspC domain-containing protein n=1 Tax=Ferrimonas lipolytica TaxID=2724191 RepID=A0A6H1UFC0_9GAMM|nr:PspC domain-containing protein [Ferrimonas lipolytica]QIZ77781.1 PspC domain-containing protein [Ferrimonas lipolytica]